jgi:hypothetical protein
MVRMNTVRQLTAFNLIYLFYIYNEIIGAIMTLYIYKRGGIKKFDYDFIFNQNGLVNLKNNQSKLKL